VAAAFDEFTDQLYFIEYDTLRRDGRQEARRHEQQAADRRRERDAYYGPSPLSVQLTGSNSYDPEGSASPTCGTSATDSLRRRPTPCTCSRTSGPAGPQLRNVTLTVKDPGLNQDTTSSPSAWTTRPPQVSITSPVNGSYFSMTQNTQVPLTAVISDNEFSKRAALLLLAGHAAPRRAHAPRAARPGLLDDAIISPVGCDATRTTTSSR
jgi:hypothetical protein